MSKPESAPIIRRGERITIYDDDPGSIVAIRWNKYAGWTYGIRPDNGGRVFFVWESQVARAISSANVAMNVADEPPTDNPPHPKAE
jgi:hypothetical protein